jgi:hypothetical protein
MGILPELTLPAPWASTARLSPVRPLTGLSFQRAPRSAVSEQCQRACYMVGGERPVPWSFVQSLLTPLENQIAEFSPRPTQESYDAVVAERDARFTENQIRAMSEDYTIGLNAVGNVQMKITSFEFNDLNTFAPFTVNPESVSVIDGKICLEFVPEDNATLLPVQCAVVQLTAIPHPSPFFLHPDTLMQERVKKVPALLPHN